MQAKSILFTGIFSGLIYLIPTSKAFAQLWSPICVRQPIDITKQNTATIKSEDCLTSDTQAVLNGQLGNLDISIFRDGETIRTFTVRCAGRFGPCQIQISINRGEWFDGVYERTGELSYQCGIYRCGWDTYRDSFGKLILGTGMSY